MVTKVKCPYAEKCIDADSKCDSCLNNEKRSYYRPNYYPPQNPWYWDSWTIILTVDGANKYRLPGSYYTQA